MEGVSIDVLPNPSATALGVALASILGLLAGVLPAWSAARREIVVGLRDR
jgi:ABC-type antimicrobial peptide transport system permease subunit